jgi:nicotinamidase-related amidase
MSRASDEEMSFMPWDFEDHAWQDLMSAEDIELYAHYRRDTYLGKRPALLAIDLYNMAYAGGPGPVHEIAKEFPSACGDYAWDAIEPTKQLFSMMRARGFPAIYTTTEGRDEARPKTAPTTNRRQGKLGDDPLGIFPAFNPHPEDLTIYKLRASGFYGTPLVAHLTQLGVDTVVICGESTSGCVRASVADAYSNGFHVVVVEESTYDRSLVSHKVNLFDMHHKYADVMHLDEVAEHLQAFPEV